MCVRGGEEGHGSFFLFSFIKKKKSYHNLFIFFSSCVRYWLDLTPSDVIWNIADTGWILTSLTSVFDAWVFGSCIFVHQLPQIESATILNVRKKLWICVNLQKGSKK